MRAGVCGVVGTGVRLIGDFILFQGLLHCEGSWFRRVLKCEASKMFYGWEVYVQESLRELDSSMASLPDSVESLQVLKKKVAVLEREAQVKASTISTLQRELESTAETLKREQSQLSEVTARNRHLERELEERISRERGLEKQIKDEEDKQNRKFVEMKLWYEKEIQTLISSLQTLEEAEERLCVQLGDLEGEAMENSRYFDSELSSLSNSLTRTNEELTSAQSEVKSLRGRELTLKELDVMDLSSQLSKAKHERDGLGIMMRETTTLFQGELEKARAQVESLKKELAMVELLGQFQTKRGRWAENDQRSFQLCRSESLSWVESQRIVAV